MSYYWDDNSSSTTSTVTGARHSTTELRALSARPQVTYVKPWYDTYPKINNGFKTQLTVEGYMFDRVTNVYISAGDGVYTTPPMSILSAYDPFSGTSPLTGKNLQALYPAFTGVELDSVYWRVNTQNTMSIWLSATEGTGNIDLIIQNPAGYCLLSTALSGSLINVV